MKSERNQIKMGALFSYLLIIANTLYGIFFTPFLVTSLGSGEYGVYQLTGSLAGSLTILDFGIGSTTLRYISQYNAEGNKKSMSNFSAMMFLQATVLSACMGVVCILIYYNIDDIYGQSLNTYELVQAHKLFFLFGVILVINTYDQVAFGIIAGCQKFLFANGLKLGGLGFRILLAYCVIQYRADSVYLMIVNVSTAAILLLLKLFYIRLKLELAVRIMKWDQFIFKQSFGYTVLMFIQSVTTQFHGNLDNLVIGAYIGASAVAVYSIGLRLYNMYEQFAVAFSDLMLPTISRQIVSGASLQELEDTVIKVGRLEFMALGAALSGFVVIGKEFLDLWLGDAYSSAWIVGVVLMVPTTIPLMQNVCLSILRAQNRMQFRTFALCFMACFNLLITIWGVPRFGPIAACIGTAAGLILANIIAMNIYYVKVIHLNIFRIFKGILSRSWVCCVFSALVLKAADLLIAGSWMQWLLKVILFCITYGISLMVYGLNSEEKKSILNMLH